MPRWIIYNSPDDCPASEQKVAEFLQGLDDSFTVRWGWGDSLLDCRLKTVRRNRKDGILGKVRIAYATA